MKLDKRRDDSLKKLCKSDDSKAQRRSSSTVSRSSTRDSGDRLKSDSMQYREKLARSSKNQTKSELASGKSSPSSTDNREKKHRKTESANAAGKYNERKSGGLKLDRQLQLSIPDVVRSSHKSTSVNTTSAEHGNFKLKHRDFKTKTEVVAQSGSGIVYTSDDSQATSGTSKRNLFETFKSSASSVHPQRRKSAAGRDARTSIDVDVADSQEENVRAFLEMTRSGAVQRLKSSANAAGGKSSGILSGLAVDSMDMDFMDLTASDDELAAEVLQANEVKPRQHKMSKEKNKQEISSKKSSKKSADIDKLLASIGRKDAETPKLKLKVEIDDDAKPEAKTQTSSDQHDVIALGLVSPRHARLVSKRKLVRVLAVTSDVLEKVPRITCSVTSASASKLALEEAQQASAEESVEMADVEDYIPGVICVLPTSVAESRQTSTSLSEESVALPAAVVRSVSTLSVWRGRRKQRSPKKKRRERSSCSNELSSTRRKRTSVEGGSKERRSRRSLGRVQYADNSEGSSDGSERAEVVKRIKLESPLQLIVEKYTSDSEGSSQNHNTARKEPSLNIDNPKDINESTRVSEYNLNLKHATTDSGSATTDTRTNRSSSIGSGRPSSSSEELTKVKSVKVSDAVPSAAASTCEVSESKLLKRAHDIGDEDLSHESDGSEILIDNLAGNKPGTSVVEEKRSENNNPVDSATTSAMQRDDVSPLRDADDAASESGCLVIVEENSSAQSASKSASEESVPEKEKPAKEAVAVNGAKLEESTKTDNDVHVQVADVGVGKTRSEDTGEKVATNKTINKEVERRQPSETELKEKPKSVPEILREIQERKQLIKDRELHSPRKQDAISSISQVSKISENVSVKKSVISDIEASLKNTVKTASEQKKESGSDSQPEAQHNTGIDAYLSFCASRGNTGAPPSKTGTAVSTSKTSPTHTKPKPSVAPVSITSITSGVTSIIDPSTSPVSLCKATIFEPHQKSSQPNASSLKASPLSDNRMQSSTLKVSSDRVFDPVTGITVHTRSRMQVDGRAPAHRITFPPGFFSDLYKIGDGVWVQTPDGGEKTDTAQSQNFLTLVQVASMAREEEKSKGHESGHVSGCQCKDVANKVQDLCS